MILPKFLLCSSNLENVFVLHTQFPKLIAIVENDNQGSNLNVLEFFDKIEITDSTPLELAKLMREMGDWYSSQIS